MGCFVCWWDLITVGGVFDLFDCLCYVGVVGLT